MFFQTLDIQPHERAVVTRGGIPRRVLGPGRHTMWVGFGRLRAWILDTRAVVLDAPREVRACLADDEIAEAHVGPDQRGVLFRDARPVAYLRPGVHRYWTVDPSVTLHLYDATRPLEGVTDELLLAIPKGELVDVTVHEFERGLMYEGGRFQRVLEAGRHVRWTRAEAPLAIRVVDMRQRQLVVAGQELLTKDKVTLRMSLVLEWKPTDPTTAQHVVADPEASLYALVQLMIRDFVAGVTLDELLEGREALSQHLWAREPEARALGAFFCDIGVKDIILPGDMKLLLNRVIEAEKQAAANVILRQEEAAATRTMANAAKVMADNPILLRLKELEALERVASHVGEVKLVLGDDGLRAMLPRAT